MSSIPKESEFYAFMRTNGPHSDSSKRNYISWLRFINDNFQFFFTSISEQAIDGICNSLRESISARSVYTRENDVSNIKSALNKYLAFTKTNISLSDSSLIASSLNLQLTTTQKFLLDSRIGQGKYRNELINLWGACSVTGYKNINFLRASHIKPWRSCSDTERLDPYNGLLLMPNLDSVFDLGYISFSETGQILISKLLSPDDMQHLSISGSMKLMKIQYETESYMSYHRENIFLK